jgi:hypothetical protein
LFSFFYFESEGGSERQKNILSLSITWQKIEIFKWDILWSNQNNFWTQSIYKNRGHLILININVDECSK